MVLDFVGLPGGGEPASAGRVLWQLADHLGTTRDVVDSQGFFVVHFTYDSFGRLTSGAENVVTRYLYTGREWDAAAELQYNRARWCDPAAQRWIRLDPLGFTAGDANLDRYVANAPTNATDPSGLYEASTTVIAIGHRAWAYRTAVAAGQSGGGKAANRKTGFVDAIGCSIDGESPHAKLGRNGFNTVPGLPRLPELVWRPGESGATLDWKTARDHQQVSDRGVKTKYGYMAPQNQKSWPGNTPVFEGAGSRQAFLENAYRKYQCVIREYIAVTVEHAIQEMRRNGTEKWDVTIRLQGEAGFTIENLTRDIFGYDNPGAAIALGDGVTMDVRKGTETLRLTVKPNDGMGASIIPNNYKLIGIFGR